MKKADRLFQLVTLLQGRRTATTAQAMAKSLGVSLRTVYRDIKGLAQSGVMIEGDPGVGYLLRHQSHVPPLMFSADEVLAILVGSQMAQAFTDPQLALSAQRAEQKIRAVLPQVLRQRADQSPYRIPILAKDQILREHHGLIRVACEKQLKMRVFYADEAGRSTKRKVWPLGIVGLHGKWLLLAWCELRQDYRTFRFDRIQTLAMSIDTFKTSATVCMDHYFSQLLRNQLDEELRRS
ncbi:MAG: YafY family protein [Pseudomonadota bacterium]